MGPPKPKSDKFLWVFGNQIQEYLADRIWEEVQSKHLHLRRDEAVKISYSIAEEWFGQDFLKDEMPFTKEWFKQYVEGRFFGYIEGTYPEAKIERGKREFEARYPKEKCQWYLGCPLTEEELKSRGETLQCDHKWPLASRGLSFPENCQWLCRKHNIVWKNKTIFWGENFIPCGKYRQKKAGSKYV